LLKEQIAAQEERARGVTERERTLQETLVTTQRLVEEMKNNARREAELILREAEMTGEKSVEAARAEEGKIRADITALKRARRAGLGGAGGPRRARPRQAGASDGPEPRGNSKEARRRGTMNTTLVLGALAAALVTAAPAWADHNRLVAPAEEGTKTDGSLDIDLKLGVNGFRFGSRLFGREGYAGGAWLNGETRPEGFSLDGR